MKRSISKLISFIMAVTVVISLAGCAGNPNSYSLESTQVPGSLPAEETTAPYVRKEFKASEYPYFALLSETEKNAYSQIYEELWEGNDRFECRILLSADELSKAIDSVLNDHPELFWLDNNYGYTYDPSDGSIKEITFTFFDFADTPEKLKKARSEFDSITSAVAAEAMKYQSTVDRELYIHDYICSNTEYDESGPYNQSAYSALILHTSVCAGYAKSFQYLMQKAGVPCYYVTGRTDGIADKVIGGSGEGGSHSWDMVLLDGDFYNVDCLWDDTASDTYGSMIYPFFNLTDDELLYHARTNMAVRLPLCRATKYKYSNHFGPTIEATSISFADAG